MVRNKDLTESEKKGNLRKTLRNCSRLLKKKLAAALALLKQIIKK